MPNDMSPQPRVRGTLGLNLQALPLDSNVGTVTLPKPAAPAPRSSPEFHESENLKQGHDFGDLWTAVRIEDQDRRQREIHRLTVGLSKAARMAWQKTQTAAARREMCKLFPAVLDPTDPKPLAIGAGTELRIAIKAVLPVATSAITAAITKWVKSEGYRAALRKPGSMRHSLDSTPVEPVSEENRASA